MTSHLFPARESLVGDGKIVNLSYSAVANLGLNNNTNYKGGFPLFPLLFMPNLAGTMVPD